MKRAVLCVGSPFGDDALGMAAAPLIAARLAPLGIPVWTLDRPGARLVQALEGLDEAILVDAVVSGAPVGTLHRLEEEAVLRQLARHTSTHGFGLADALALSRRLGNGPRRFILYGLEIIHPRQAFGLDAHLAAALPVLVEAVCAECEGQGDGT
ncbi:hydrogenase maturation protease [Thiobacter aerophilum]|uniref:Hydrogenase maturation protease n=1 Tax=Thiobacter aerophilum TaxID=3121275 RepID=A0ABV0EAY0_9BURK